MADTAARAETAGGNNEDRGSDDDDAVHHTAAAAAAPPAPLTAALPSSTSSCSTVVRILTVGDGDLSCSLALLRAYGGGDGNNKRRQRRLVLVATTLLASEAELIATYPHSRAIVEELLLTTTTTILYGVDATQLHRHPELLAVTDKFDCVLFHHPHLGYGGDGEQERAENHAALLAHYLWSARHIVRQRPTIAATADNNNAVEGGGGGGGGGAAGWDCGCGVVHVCLCGSQFHTWKLPEAMRRLGLEPAPDSPRSTARPIFPHLLLPVAATAATVATESSGGQADGGGREHRHQQQQKAPRKWRNGKLGSRHWLGLYGYRHRPTFPDNTHETNVSNSYHYFMVPEERTKEPTTPQTAGVGLAATATTAQDGSTTAFRCEICLKTFDTARALEAHKRAPALPVISTPGISDDSPNKETTRKRPVNNDTDTIDAKLQQGKGEGTVVDNVNDDGGGASACSVTADAGNGDNASVLTSVTVFEPHDGKRLRWLLQHASPLGWSKRQCERAIAHDRQVSVNGIVAGDSGRIVRTGDRIQVVDSHSPSPQSDSRTATAATMIRIVESWTPTCHVVYKPVGMAISSGGGGNNSTLIIDPKNTSLEGCFSRQQGVPYVCRTKLDRGCSGLVVLCIVTEQQQETDETILGSTCSLTRVFVALVHGHWELDRQKVKLQVDGVRRWGNKKKKIKKQKLADNDDVSFQEKEVDDVDGDSTAEISVLERTPPTEGVNPDNIPALSTVMIRTQSSASSMANVLCYYLRKAGHPVVSDRFAGSEYFTLPRSIRNRIKQNLCIGCTRLELAMASATSGSDTAQSGGGGRSHFAAETPLPEKWSAKYWEGHCRNKIEPSSSQSEPSIG